MIRHAVVLAVALVFWVLSILLKQHREKVLIVGILVLSIIGGIYCYSHIEGIIVSKQPKTQTFYNVDYLETEEYADAFLRLFLKDKTVYVKNDRWILEDAEDAGYEWIYAYYHVDNMENFLNSVGANVVEDETMNEICVSEEASGNFEKVGYLNDLLRNSLMYTKHTTGCGNYLFYMLYYKEQTDTAYLYADPESLSEDDLVLIWQPRSEDNVETEDMYLMGKTYFEEHFR